MILLVFFPWCFATGWILGLAGAELTLYRATSTWGVVPTWWWPPGLTAWTSCAVVLLWARLGRGRWF